MKAGLRSGEALILRGRSRSDVGLGISTRSLEILSYINYLLARSYQYRFTKRPTTRPIELIMARGGFQAEKEVRGRERERKMKISSNNFFDVRTVDVSIPSGEMRSLVEFPTARVPISSLVSKGKQ